MISAEEIDHQKRNQTNYDEKAEEHNTLSLNSTLYLAYRDINALLERHLYPKLKPENKKIRLLDFGCGVGLSTKMVLDHIGTRSQYTVEAVGVDINEANLDIARKKLPQVDFKCISTNSALDDIDQFDLIICNFVLVEMQTDQMQSVLNLLKTKLSENGIIIVTNTTGKVYRHENSWCTFNNKFSENILTPETGTQEKLKYTEDQPVKLQVFAAKDRSESFTFFDYFHSGSAYRKTYSAAGLQLKETHKPIGRSEDQIDWQAEAIKPPYKIHILGH